MNSTVRDLPYMMRLFANTRRAFNPAGGSYHLISDYSVSERPLHEFCEFKGPQKESLFSTRLDLDPALKQFRGAELLHTNTAIEIDPCY